VGRAEGLCHAGVELGGKFTPPDALCLHLLDFATISYVTQGIMPTEPVSFLS
jgi:hypothetical protein